MTKPTIPEIKPLLKNCRRPGGIRTEYGLGRMARKFICIRLMISISITGISSSRMGSLLMAVWGYSADRGLRMHPPGGHKGPDPDGGSSPWRAAVKGQRHSNDYRLEKDLHLEVTGRGQGYSLGQLCVPLLGPVVLDGHFQCFLATHQDHQLFTSSHCSVNQISLQQ